MCVATCEAVSLCIATCHAVSLCVSRLVTQCHSVCRDLSLSVTVCVATCNAVSFCMCMCMCVCVCREFSPVTLNVSRLVLLVLTLIRAF